MNEIYWKKKLVTNSCTFYEKMKTRSYLYWSIIALVDLWASKLNIYLTQETTGHFVLTNFLKKVLFDEFLTIF